MIESNIIYKKNPPDAKITEMIAYRAEAGTTLLIKSRETKNKTSMKAVSPIKARINSVILVPTECSVLLVSVFFNTFVFIFRNNDSTVVKVAR